MSFYSFWDMLELMRTLILLLVTSGSLHGQPASFEVASFKRVEPAEMERMAAAERSGQITGVKFGFSGGPGTTTPEHFTAEYVTLARLIARAYDLKPYQFKPPEWMGVERYRLDARLPVGVTEPRFRLMLQNLLGERLDLKVHWESKEMPVYELSVSSGGIKFYATAPERRHELRVPEDYPSLPPGEEPALNVQRGRAVWRARGETM